MDRPSVLPIAGEPNMVVDLPNAELLYDPEMDVGQAHQAIAQALAEIQGSIARLDDTKLLDRIIRSYGNWLGTKNWNFQVKRKKGAIRLAENHTAIREFEKGHMIHQLKSRQSMALLSRAAFAAMSVLPSTRPFGIMGLLGTNFVPLWKTNRKLKDLKSHGYGTYSQINAELAFIQR